MFPMRLFECLPKGDLEHRINGGLRPPAFAKGTQQSSAFARVLHLQIITEALEKFKVKASDRYTRYGKEFP